MTWPSRLVLVLAFAYDARHGAGVRRRPGMVRAFADVNPVSLTVNAACGLMIGHGPVLGPALGSLAWLPGLLLVVVVLATRTLQRG